MIGVSQVEQLANTVILAGAGAFTDLNPFVCEDAERISLIVQYDPVNATGFPRLRIQWDYQDSNAAIAVPARVPGVIISGTTLLREDWDIANSDASNAVYTRVIDIQIPPGAWRAVFSIAEVGDTANPGTINVWIAMGVEG